jgi:hypothetical protein
MFDLLMKKPIKIVTIVLAVPVNSETYMDILSGARDDSSGEIIEWAAAKDADGYRVDDKIVDGETPEMLELFESDYVSPELRKAEEKRK